jgi:hypothetical protein
MVGKGYRRRHRHLHASSLSIRSLYPLRYTIVVDTYQWLLPLRVFKLLHTFHPFSTTNIRLPKLCLVEDAINPFPLCYPFTHLRLRHRYFLPLSLHREKTGTSTECPSNTDLYTMASCKLNTCHSPVTNGNEFASAEFAARFKLIYDRLLFCEPFLKGSFGVIDRHSLRM